MGRLVSFFFFFGVENAWLELGSEMFEFKCLISLFKSAILCGIERAEFGDTEDGFEFLEAVGKDRCGEEGQIFEDIEEELEGFDGFCSAGFIFVFFSRFSFGDEFVGFLDEAVSVLQIALEIEVFEIAVWDLGEKVCKIQIRVLLISLCKEYRDSFPFIDLVFFAEIGDPVDKVTPGSDQHTIVDIC